MIGDRNPLIRSPIFIDRHGKIPIIDCSDRLLNTTDHEVLLPLLKSWYVEVENVIRINDTDITIIEHEVGIESNEKHVDTKIVISVNDSRLVLHAYNSTQNLMVQGRNHQNFAVSCLEPFFKMKIEESSDKITELNANIKEAFEQNIRDNAKVQKTRHCPVCNFQTNTHVALKVHVNSCHTKPKLESLKQSKVLKSISPIRGGLISSSVVTLDDGSKDAMHSPILEVLDLFSCDLCEYDTASSDELHNHMNSIHAQTVTSKPNTPSVQGQISMQSEVQKEIIVQSSDYNVDVLGSCDLCDFKSSLEHELRVHLQLEHMRPSVNVVSTPTVLHCSVCNYTCRLNIQLKQHVKKHHLHRTVYTCYKCRYVSNSISDMWQHSLGKHEEEHSTTIRPENNKIDLNAVAEQMVSLNEEVESVKTEFKRAFKELEKLLNEGLHKILDDNKDKYDKLTELVTKVKGKVNHVGRRVVDSIDHSNQPNTSQNDAGIHTLYATVTTQTDPELFDSIEEPPQRICIDQVQKKKSLFLQQPKVLYVTDSVGSSTNMRLVEKFSKARVRTKKVSGSEELEHTVDENLEYPGREPYKILAISAPTNDISNLKHKKLNKIDLEKHVKHSCQNIIKTAEKALKCHKDLEKVVIIEHPPRFDDKLTSEMAKFANETLNQNIENLNNVKIDMGRHNLNCYGIGKTYDARYKDSLSKRDDGLHFYGPLGIKDYSESLINILSQSISKDVPELASPIIEPEPAIQLQNRFAVFDQGNL